MLRAAVGVVGAGRPGRAGHQAVVGREEAAGALGRVPDHGQRPELALTLHLEEGPLGRVALLAGREAAQGRFQVRAPRGPRLAQGLGSPNAGEAGRGKAGERRLVNN